MADGMMGNPFLGLLNQGMSPEQAQAEVDRQRALQFANLNPQQRVAAGIYEGITGIGRALGARDPMLEQASQLRQLAGQFDTNTAEGLRQFANAARSINSQVARDAAMQAEKMQEQTAKTRKTTAEAARFETETARKERVREELAKLPENATEEDMLNVIRRYGGNIDDMMKAIEAKQRQTAQLTARREEAVRRSEDRERELKATLENRLEVARLRGESAATLAQIRLDGQAQLEAIRQENRINLFKAKEEAKGAKPLTAGLQKDEDSDLSRISSNADLISSVNRPIDALESGTLKLGPVKNLQNTLMNWAGSSNEASQAYADMQRAIQSATNIKVSAEKGVQTDKDVLRFANELVAAAGKNDTKVLLDALKNFKTAAEKEVESKKKSIQNRRKSQQVKLYDFEDEFSPTKTMEDKFVVGRIYEDGKGNRAKYLGNGKWENQ